MRRTDAFQARHCHEVSSHSVQAFAEYVSESLVVSNSPGQIHRYWLTQNDWGKVRHLSFGRNQCCQYSRNARKGALCSGKRWIYVSLAVRQVRAKHCLHTFYCFLSNEKPYWGTNGGTNPSNTDSYKERWLPMHEYGLYRPKQEAGRENLPTDWIQARG